MAGCYSVDLYCRGCSMVHDHPYDPCATPSPSQFFGNTEKDCLKEAKQKGWKFKFGECWCKNCKPFKL